MKALQYREYGAPDVLEVADADEPHARPGTVRIAVKAASVNPIDWKARQGLLSKEPLDAPVIAGYDGAGVVDEVGDGVDGVAVGDEVFGLGSATQAEHAVLEAWAVKPAAMSWTEAAALPVAFETAARAFDLVGVGDGTTVVVDGAAGGVGSAAVQLGVARGATVIGTASEGNHDYLRSIGASPTTYGDGLAERVAELAPQGVDAGFDTAGKGSVATLIEIVGDPQKVVTIADFSAGALGAHVTGGRSPRAADFLAEAASLYEQGKLEVTVAKTFPLADAAEAHRESQGGHVRGKLVLVVE